MVSNEFDDGIVSPVMPELDITSCLVEDNASYHIVTSQDNKVHTAKKINGRQTDKLNKRWIVY